MTGSGNNNAIAGGVQNTIGAGGTSNTNTNFIGAGRLNVAQFGSGNFVGAGADNVASLGSHNAIGAGQFNAVGGESSGILAGEFGTDRSRFAWQGFASGSFVTSPATQGTAQTGAQLFRAAGATAAAIRLTADQTAPDAANCMNIPNATRYALTVTLEAFDITTPANGYTARWTGAHDMLRGAGAATVVVDGGTSSVAPDIFRLAGTATGETAVIAADVTNGCLAVTFTPPSGNTDTWHAVAKVEAVEVQ